MEQTGERQEITIAELAEVTGDAYNSVYVSVKRGNVKQIRDGYPATFDKVEALQHAHRMKTRRKSWAERSANLAAGVKKYWLENGVPQSVGVIASDLGYEQGSRSVNVAVKAAVDAGEIVRIKAHGTAFYVPKGARVKQPKSKPDLSALSDTEKAAFNAIVDGYKSRLVPLSMVEIGEAIANKFPRYPVFKLVDVGLVRKAPSGERELFVPVGWSATVGR